MGREQQTVAGEIRIYNFHEKHLVFVTETVPRDFRVATTLNQKVQLVCSLQYGPKTRTWGNNHARVLPPSLSPSLLPQSPAQEPPPPLPVINARLGVGVRGTPSISMVTLSMVIADCPGMAMASGFMQVVRMNAWRERETLVCLSVNLGKTSPRFAWPSASVEDFEIQKRRHHQQQKYQQHTAQSGKL